MVNTDIDFGYLVRVSKPGYDDASRGDAINIRAGHWMPAAARRLPYNAFKLYLLFGSCDDKDIYYFENKLVHDSLGLSLTGSYNKAFNELVEAGYVHRYGPYSKRGDVLYDFFLEPISDSDYSAFVENYYAEQ